MTSLVNELGDICLPYLSDVRIFWDMTAYELLLAAEAGRKKEHEVIRENELLAFNIGALVLTAFNAPQRFPADPDSAFGHSNWNTPDDGGKSGFMALANNINRRFGEI